MACSNLGIKITYRGKPMSHISAHDTGWLTVLFEPSKEKVSLPHSLQVEVTKSKDGRDFFTILEGIYKGKKASVKAGNLGNVSITTGPAKLIFDIGKSTLTYAGSSTAKAITSEVNPIGKGTHKIQLPDFPHGEYGRPYLGQSAYALSWFYMGLGHAIPGKNDRYLHTGAVSNGCVTVEPADWTKIYKYLIQSRQGDQTNVGIIKVIK